MNKNLLALIKEAQKVKGNVIVRGIDKSTMTQEFEVRPEDAVVLLSAEELLIVPYKVEEGTKVYMGTPYKRFTYWYNGEEEQIAVAKEVELPNIEDCQEIDLSKL